MLGQGNRVHETVEAYGGVLHIVQVTARRLPCTILCQAFNLTVKGFATAVGGSQVPDEESTNSKGNDTSAACHLHYKERRRECRQKVSVPEFLEHLGHCELSMSLGSPCHPLYIQCHGYQRALESTALSVTLRAGRVNLDAEGGG